MTFQKQILTIINIFHGSSFLELGIKFIFDVNLDAEQ